MTENCLVQENGHDWVKRTHSDPTDALELNRLSLRKEGKKFSGDTEVSTNSCTQIEVVEEQQNHANMDR